MKKLFGAALAAIVMSWASAANAIWLGDLRTTETLTWTQSADATGGTLVGSGQGLFRFYRESENIGVAQGLTQSLPVTFTLLANHASGGPAGRHLVTMDFAITYTGLTPLVTADGTYLPGANILSGTGIAGRMLEGTYATGPYFDFANGRDAAFSSDFATFARHPVNTFGLLAVSPTSFSAEQGESLGSFTSSGGKFVFAATAPEPATWAMMIIGFGLAGSGLRAHRNRLPRAA